MTRLTPAKRMAADRIYELVLNAIKSGAATSAEIYEHAHKNGLVLQAKNLYPYIYAMHNAGMVEQVGRHRPAKWGISPPKVPKSDASALPENLQLLMGYNPHPVPKGTVVSPLTQLELGEYGKQPSRKHKCEVRIQSGLRESIYQD